MFLWESPVCILCWLYPCELSTPLLSTQQTGGAGLTGLAFWRAVSGFYLIFVIIITHHEFCFSHLQALMRYEKSRQSSTCYFCAITNKFLTWHRHYRAEKILENDEESFMSSSLKTNVKSCYLDLHILNSGEGRKKSRKVHRIFFHIKVGIQNMSSNSSSFQFFFSYER